ncbi:sll0787 family AIR synthase-like protein [Serratia sp. M24T3]|uniref:sll0787 family AIR synthase-like protein n=1 Tax=Serratia sp. M24T3 TaxID=932213 RepID=UPI00025BA2A1|nr:sll0787 family AIR synthase-like protein [Serratia sp. M24T3]EIC86125.1 hypothetical protein SPM24T3_01968 [Serratia sp. M24T3]
MLTLESPATLCELLTRIRHYSGIAHKRDIQLVPQQLKAASLFDYYPNGDDCAVLPNGEGYSLLAIEGFINRFVEEDPWFAGWCGVMVNVSDIAAMGGRPQAVVNALWSAGEDKAAQVLAGMAAASAAFGVPIVGGHTNLRSQQTQLSVAILGQAKALLSGFAARPGQAVVAAIDLRGSWRAPNLNWNAATTADPAMLRRCIDLLPQIAECGLAVAAKDISQAGLLGTLTMLLESSQVGAKITLESIPKPPDESWQDWLCAFPSFGYLLTTPTTKTADLIEQFNQCGIAAAVIGEVTDSLRLDVMTNNQCECFWDLAESALTGFAPSTS